MSEYYYVVDLKCANYKRINWNIQIPKKMTIEEFGENKNIKCRICGCDVIKIKEKKK
jgi:hypothetical protein